jgi:hypothetical protein
MATLSLALPASVGEKVISVTLHFGRTEIEASASLPDGEPVRTAFRFATHGGGHGESRAVGQAGSGQLAAT